MPDDPKKPKPTKPFVWQVDNPFAGPISGLVHAATAAEAERQAKEWLTQGLTVKPAGEG